MNFSVKKFKFLLFSMLVTLLFSSCVTSKRLNYLQKPGLTIPSYPVDSYVSDYKLQLGDQVSVMINSLNEESVILFSGQSGMGSSNLYSYTIYADSCIDFPFVGEIKIAGLTTRVAKDTIKQKLQPYMKECQVDVKLVNSYFTVIGEGASGRYPIPKEKLNVLQVLAITGGFTSVTDRSKIHVLRPGPNGTEIRMFDIRSKDIINSEFYYVQPNDVIYVQDFNGQFFRVESFGSLLSTISTTLSFGYLLYNFTIK